MLLFVNVCHFNVRAQFCWRHKQAFDSAFSGGVSELKF